VTRKPGYVHCLESAQFDLLRFEELLSQGRAQLAAGDAKGGASRLRRPSTRGGHRCWPTFVTVEAARLYHLRLDALETCFEAELAASRGDAGRRLVTST